jgi:hypothetical protein
MIKRFKVYGCFCIAVESEDDREAKEIVGRILKAEGIEHLITGVKLIPDIEQELRGVVSEHGS